MGISKNKIMGIIFDLDGTLYHMKWFMKPLFALKLFPTPWLLPRYMSVRKNYMGKDLKSGDALLDSIAQDLSGKSSKSKVVIRSWITDVFYPTFVSIMKHFKDCRPGCNELLLELKKKGYKIAVLSDFAAISKRLLALDIDKDLFDIIISSETYGALKPHPKPFIDIATQWQIDAKNILVIGDREDTDGDAAQKTGMQFQLITDKKRGSDNALLWKPLKEKLYTLPQLD